MGMRQRDIPKAYQALAKLAWEQGWQIMWTSKNHLRWVNPDGQSVYTPGTPSVNGTGMIRINSKLRRNGLVLK